MPAWLLVGAMCGSVALLADLSISHEHGLSGDEPYYERMAAHPAGIHNFPYAFRIGIPWLVHVLPFSHSFSFGLLALLASAASGAALFELLREFDVGIRVAVGLAVGFTISPPLLVVLLRNGRGVDSASILVLILGTLFIVRRRKVALAITMLLGTTIHETTLFLIPLAYAVWADRVIDRRALGDITAVSLFPIATYAFLRLSIRAAGESYQPGYTGSFLHARSEIIKRSLTNGGWRRELRRMAIVYGPLWLVAPFSVRHLRFAQRGLLALVPVGAISMTYATDWGRVIFYAAPVLYVAAAYTIRHRRRLAAVTIAALLALDIGYGVYMQVHGVRHGLDSTAPPARGPVY